MMPSVKVPRHKKTGEWVEEEGWYVYRERTTRPFGQIKPEATRMLFRGSAALATTHQWNGETLHVRTIGMEGLVSLEDGYLTMRTDVPESHICLTSGCHCLPVRRECQVLNGRAMSGLPYQVTIPGPRSDLAIGTSCS